MQLETIITASLPRTRCPDCGVKTVAVPWAEPHGRFTLLFESFALRVLKMAASQKAAADLLKLDWHTAQEVMARGVQRGLGRRDVSQVRGVGMDEKSFKRGQSYVSILTEADADGTEPRVLEVVPERTAAAGALLLEQALGAGGCAALETVAMDMSAGYENAVKRLAPQAWIVHDRFHVMKLLNDAVDQVRRAEHKAWKKDGDNRLAGTRYLWLRSPASIGEEQAESFEKLRRSKSRTARAWGLKELFREVYEAPGFEAAYALYRRWRGWALRSRITPMKKVAQTIHRRWLRVLWWHIRRVSNGPAEGFNSAIQSVKSAARGFRSFANYRVRILFRCGKLDMMPALPGMSCH